MLVSQTAHSEADSGQGSPGVGLAELRRRLAKPSRLSDGHRQRLLELERRLARVQALGNEYARLELSEYVAAATDRGAVTT